MGPTTWGSKRPEIRGLGGTQATLTEVVPAVEGLYNYNYKDRGKISKTLFSNAHHSLTTVLWY